MKREFAFNSTLRPISKKKMAQKKPLQRKKPLPLSEVKKRFEITVAALLGPPLPRKPMKKRSRNNVGWVDVAMGIWNECDNDHRCCVCGLFLGDDFSPAFYHHILHRGSYRRFKRRPDNLAQLCVNDHEKAHKHGIENLAEEGDENARGWMLLHKRLMALRDEAHGIK